MAIKASGNSLRFTEIENEFGQGGGTRSLGTYRLQNVNIGGLTEVSLSRDGCGIDANSSIPVDNQPIKFSDFYNAKQNIIVNFFDSDQNRKNAKTEYSNDNVTVVGPGSKPSNTSGKKVIIHVTKKLVV